MRSDETGRLLIHTHDFQAFDYSTVPQAELIDLSAALQRRFPDQLVEPADMQWVHQALGDSLPNLEPRYRFHANTRDMGPPPFHDYIYLVLAWLGGTVSKQATEQVIKTVADLVTEWMRKRRHMKENKVVQTAFILGPDGEILKKVEMWPGWEAPRRRR
jgi:hypothetical protein